MIRNLAIKGGGVRGIAFVGALKELNAANILPAIERVSGTSAGAMLAAMISAGYGVEEIDRLMQSIDFKKFEESFNPLAVVTHYGMHSGDYILDFTKQFLKSSPRGLSEDCSFADMKKAGCKDLYVFATDLNAMTVAEFSFDKTPGVKVAEAVRASMSIPIYFRAWQFPDKNPNDHIYVDGGTVFNYPLSFFDDNRFTPAEVNEESIGLFLQSKTRTEAQFGFDHLLHYTRHLFEVLLNSQDVDFDEDHVLYSRSIVIDDLGILSTDFHLGPDDMKNLTASGSKAASAFLKQNPSLIPVKSPAASI